MAVSTNIVKTLLEREWVRVVGHRDVPGRPAMYATTRQFLDYFNLKSLDQLPPLAEIKELDNLSGELALELPEAAAEALGSDESVAEGVDAELESMESDADAAEATTQEVERADNGEQETPSP